MVSLNWPTCQKGTIHDASCFVPYNFTIPLFELSSFHFLQFYNFLNRALGASQVFKFQPVQIYNLLFGYINILHMSATIIPENSRNNISYDGTTQLPEATKQSVALATPVKVVIVIAVLAIIAGVAVGLAVGLTRKKGAEESNDIQPSPSPSPTPTPFTCDQSPSECVGVPASVQSYILSNYTDPQQARSMMQLSRTLSAIPVNASRDNLTAGYSAILSSVECMSYTMPDTFAQDYSNLLSLQLTDQASLSAYFSMAEAFSGQPVQLTPTADLASTCQFNTSSVAAAGGSRRRLQSQCAGQTSVLIYFSGLGSSPSKTLSELRSIRSALANSNVTFDSTLALSPSVITNSFGMMLAAISSYQQLLTNTSQGNFSQLDVMGMFRMILESPQIYNFAPGWNFRMFQAMVEYWTSQMNLAFLNMISSFNIQRHIDFIRNHLLEGKKVVLVAHAEGTQYSNAVYNGLTSAEKQSTSMVYVAPVVHALADPNSTYISNPEDLTLISLQAQAAAGQIQAPLPANVPNATFNPDPNGMNHDFRGYVRSYQSQIVQLIGDAKLRVAQPNRTLGSGPITASLTWDAQPDLDLHVFEPNFHVFYSSRTGNNGFLDLDDTNGDGPEHYYTNCALQIGDYTFKVNYYSGGAPSTATLTVSAGTQFFSKQFTIQTAVASSGDADPANNICTVTVSRSPYSGNYLFAIRSN